MIDEHTLVDGGQTAEAIAERLVAWLGEAQRSLDIALYDVRLPGPIGDSVAGAIRAAAARGVAVRIAFNEDGDRAVKPLPPPPRTEPSLLEQLGVPLRAIPGDPGPDASQVRGPRRCRGVDRVDELDPRLVDARGERAHHRRLRGAGGGLFARLRGSLEPGAGRGQRQLRHGPGRRRRGARARVVLARARSRALASHRRVHRRRPAARADRLAGADRGADPRGAQPGAGRGCRRRRRRVGRHPGRTGLRAVARERELGLEGTAARAGALRPAVVGQGLDALCAGRGPRLHARQGHGRRRHRLRRLLQPLALGREERRERARDRRRRRWPSGWRPSSTTSAGATRRSPSPPRPPAEFPVGARPRVRARRPRRGRRWR